MIETKESKYSLWTLCKSNLTLVLGLVNMTVLVVFSLFVFSFWLYWRFFSSREQQKTCGESLCLVLNWNFVLQLSLCVFAHWVTSFMSRSEFNICCVSSPHPLISQQIRPHPTQTSMCLRTAETISWILMIQRGWSSSSSLSAERIWLGRVTGRYNQ